MDAVESSLKSKRILREIKATAIGLVFIVVPCLALFLIVWGIRSLHLQWEMIMAWFCLLMGISLGVATLVSLARQAGKAFLDYRAEQNEQKEN